MRILIVEDEASIAQRIERMLLLRNVSGKMTIRISSTFDSASLYLQENTIDLLFLDLNLNGADGFQILQKAVAGSFHTIIISASADKAIQAFEYGVFDFIAKPFTQERLHKSIERLEQKNATGITTKYLAVKKSARIELIDPANMKYIIAAGDYTYLHMADNTRILHDKSLENLEMILAPAFVRIHKSYIVRVDSIKALHVTTGSKYEAEMITGEMLPIGRTRYKALKKIILK